MSSFRKKWKKFWGKVRDFVEEVFEEIINGGGSSVPEWDKCTLSSNWTGSNASKRMMNILSPKMPDAVFNERLAFMKARGCNTAHVFVTNQGDGEYSGYTIYGSSFDWGVDNSYVKTMLNRIDKLRKEKFAVVLWLASDDSSKWNATMISNFGKYCSDLKSLGFFKEVSTVVLGLELDEYWSASQVSSAVSALRKSWGGKVGIHQTSGKYSLMPFGDIAFAQMSPGQSESAIASYVATVKKATGKPVNMFELERTENRSKSNAALKAGAFAVGNW